jgi:nucleotide-binding universal stress UspA family protein
MRNVGGTRDAIILATDFSKPARRAYSYALKLSSVLKSRLILLHVVKAHPDVEGWSPAARSLLYRKEDASRDACKMIRDGDHRALIPIETFRIQDTEEL